MKATAIQNIFTQLSENCESINEGRNKKGIAPISYQMEINTSNKKYEYSLDEDSSWSIENGTLWLETNKGTQWIDIDKIESIEI